MISHSDFYGSDEKHNRITTKQRQNGIESSQRKIHPRMCTSKDINLA